VCTAMTYAHGDCVKATTHFVGVPLCAVIIISCAWGWDKHFICAHVAGTVLAVRYMVGCTTRLQGMAVTPRLKNMKLKFLLCDPKGYMHTVALFCAK
jgi:hypothetical protein